MDFLPFKLRGGLWITAAESERAVLLAVLSSILVLVHVSRMIKQQRRISEGWKESANSKTKNRKYEFKKSNFTGLRDGNHISFQQSRQREHLLRASRRFSLRNSAQHFHPSRSRKWEDGASLLCAVFPSTGENIVRGERTMKGILAITPKDLTSFDRILLHVRCLYHDHKYRWHLAGVWRELRPWHRKQSISPAAA